MPEVEWETWSFYVPLDNHEPYPRKELRGTVDRCIHPITGRRVVRVTGDLAEVLGKVKSGVILIVDDGHTAEPHYGSHQTNDNGEMFFMPFPTSETDPEKPDGTPIDWSTWFHGPVKAYHLKVRPVGDYDKGI